MRVLIADESVARSKALRASFPKVSAQGPAAGEVVISCAPASARKDECNCAGVDLADQPERAAEILDALGISLLNRGCLEEGSELIEKALRIRRKFLGPITRRRRKPQQFLARAARARRLRRSSRRRQRRVAHQSRGVRRPQPARRDQPLRAGVVQVQQSQFADARCPRTRFRHPAHARPRSYRPEHDPTARRARARGSGSRPSSGCVGDLRIAAQARPGATRHATASEVRDAPRQLRRWSRNACGAPSEAERHFAMRSSCTATRSIDRATRTSSMRWRISARCCARRSRLPARLAEAGKVLRRPCDSASRCAALRTFWSATTMRTTRAGSTTRQLRVKPEELRDGARHLPEEREGGRLDGDHSFIAEALDLARTAPGRRRHGRGGEAGATAARRRSQEMAGAAGPGTARRSRRESLPRPGHLAARHFVERRLSPAVRRLSNRARGRGPDPAFIGAWRRWIEHQGCDCDGQAAAV